MSSKPVYEVAAWPDGDWWYARVTGASEDASQAPVTRLAMGPGEKSIEQEARTVIASFLPPDGDALFDVNLTVTDHDPSPLAAG